MRALIDGFLVLSTLNFAMEDRWEVAILFGIASMVFRMLWQREILASQAAARAARKQAR